MTTLIKIEDLNYLNLNNLSFVVKDKSFITVLGPHGSGKSLLCKFLCGIIESSNVYINEDCKVLGIFSVENTPFIASTVYEELLLSSKNKESKDRINQIVNILNIEKLLNKKIKCLENHEKQLLIIACSVLMEPDVLIVDNCISDINPFYRKEILNSLKRINRIYKIAIINITGDSEQVLYGKEIAILKDGNIIAFNKKMKILSNEKNFSSNNLKTPFTVDLSLKLKYYNLVDKIVLKQEDLVDEIWK